MSQDLLLAWGCRERPGESACLEVLGKEAAQCPGKVAAVIVVTYKRGCKLAFFTHQGSATSRFSQAKSETNDSSCGLFTWGSESIFLDLDRLIKLSRSGGSVKVSVMRLRGAEGLLHLPPSDVLGHPVVVEAATKVLKRTAEYTNMFPKQGQLTRLILLHTTKAGESLDPIIHLSEGECKMKTQHEKKKEEEKLMLCPKSVEIRNTKKRWTEEDTDDGCGEDYEVREGWQNISLDDDDDEEEITGTEPKNGCYEGATEIEQSLRFYKGLGLDEREIERELKEKEIKMRIRRKSVPDILHS